MGSVCMQNKVVLITGGAKGIGKATAIAFAKKGYNIVINYLTSKTLAENLVLHLRKEFGVMAECVYGDVSDEKNVKEIVNFAISRFGKIDVLVNNSAIYNDCDFEKRQANDFIKSYNVILVGSFLMSKYVAEHMVTNKYGKIINVSSNNSLNGYDPVTIDYDCSKAALNILTKDLAVQFAPYINVNAVAPGWVMTEATKDILTDDIVEFEKTRILKERIGKPEDIANLIYFLASDEAEYINGQIIAIDGGTRN